MLGERRAAAVRTKCYCDAFVLGRVEFARIKQEYAELRDVLKKVASVRSERMSAVVLDGVVL